MLFALAQDDRYMPHGMCYMWEPGLLWTHVVADGLIALAYFAIPPALAYLVIRTRREMHHRGIDPARFRFVRILWLFAGFIVACGITHALGVYTVWNPIYYVSGSAKVVTAGISATTAIVLPFLVPRISDLFLSHFEVESTHAELERANAELTKLAAGLEAAGEERERVVRTMAGWLAHDLNNRLQGIQGSAELLALGADDGAVHDLRHEITRAAETIGNLQTLAWTDVVAPLDTVDVDEVVRDVIAEKDGPVVLQSEGHLKVPADPGRVRHIVSELIDNALGVVENGEEVVVRVLAPGAGHARVTAAIEVENPARGVDDDFLAGLFEPFVTDRPGRAGLGLAIARRRAVEMGADLDAVVPGPGRILLVLRFSRGIRDAGS